VTPLDSVALLAIGLAAGFAAGLLGVGGGIVMVPAMVLLLGFDQHVAQGTSLVVIIPAALAGSVTHYRNGRVSLRDAALLAAGGIGGAVVGSISALSVGDTVLRRLFGVFLLVVAARMVLRRGRRRTESSSPPIVEA
jgi:uncharacterized membrane protein YfcA